MAKAAERAELQILLPHRTVQMSDAYDYLLIAASFGSDIRKELKTGRRGWRWVKRFPRAAWWIALGMDLVYWTLALALITSLLMITVLIWLRS